MDYKSTVDVLLWSVDIKYIQPMEKHHQTRHNLSQLCVVLAHDLVRLHICLSHYVCLLC